MEDIDALLQGARLVSTYPTIYSSLFSLSIFLILSLFLSISISLASVHFAFKTYRFFLKYTALSLKETFFM